MYILLISPFLSGLVFPHKVTYFLEESLSDELIKSYRDDLDFQNLIDLIQQEFQCCGISSEGFRYRILHFKKSTGHIFCALQALID